MTLTAKRILVIRIDGIGDLICTTPLLESLRALFPSAKIHCLANLGPHEVLRYSALVDRLYIDYRTKVPGSRWKGLIKLPTRLLQWINRRFFGYNLVVVAHYGLQNRAMRIALGCKTPIILAHIEEEHQAQYKDSRLQLMPFKTNLHEVEGVCTMLEPLGVHVQPGAMHLTISPVIKVETLDLIYKKLEEHKGNIVGLNLSASSQSRTWPVNNFIDLILILNQRQPQLRFLVNGLPNDLKRFAGALQEHAISTADRINLRATPSLQELFACINACGIYVNSEGGTVHMAAALGVPQVAFYQNIPMKLHRWYPWGTPYKLLTPPFNGSKVSGITPAQAAEAVEALLAERA